MPSPPTYVQKNGKNSFLDPLPQSAKDIYFQSNKKGSNQTTQEKNFFEDNWVLIFFLKKSILLNYINLFYKKVLKDQSYDFLMFSKTRFHFTRKFRI
jgi:hypothetical protein